MVGPGGDRLYWGSGSTCDACKERDRAQRDDSLPTSRRQRLARGREGPAQPVRLGVPAGHRPALRDGQRPGRDRHRERPGAGGDARRRPQRRLLRLAALLAERAHASAERQLPGRDGAGRLPRAALLGRWARLLHRSQLPARVRGERLRRRVGAVPEPPLRPTSRAGAARGGPRPRDHVRRRVRAPACAAGRPARRPARGRLGTRRRVPDPGARPAPRAALY